MLINAFTAITTISNNFSARILWLVVASCAFQMSAYPTAWLRDKGELITIHSLGVATQVNSNLYDNNKVGPTSVTGFDYQLYLEYGLNSRFTIGTNSILEAYKVGSVSSAAVKLSEFFIRYGLFVSDDRSFVLSVQSLYKTPALYDNSIKINSALYGSTDQHDIELTLQMLINLNPGQGLFGYLSMSHKQLLDISFGYRQRFGLGFNEARLNVQYMFWFNQYNALLLGFYKIMRIYNSTGAYPVNFIQQISWVSNDQNTAEIGWVFFSDPHQGISVSFYADMYGLPFGAGDYNLSTFGAKLGFWFI